MIKQLPKNLLRQWQWQRLPYKRHLKFLSSSNYDPKVKKSLLSDRELSDGGIKGSAHVPKGSVVVYVGPEFRRFVIPIRFLAMPEFRDLMDEAAEEFGFQREGGLKIPCDEQYFEYVLLRCATQLNV
ncbi:hypothetical protein GQ457_07G033000 [Hibiscus cannabinus]